MLGQNINNNSLAGASCRITAKKRNNLSVATSLMIQKHKSYTSKQLSSNSLFARTFNSSNFFLTLSGANTYLIFVRVLTKTGSNANFMNFVCSTGAKFIKADNLKKDANFGDFIGRND